MTEERRGREGDLVALIAPVDRRVVSELARGEIQRLVDAGELTGVFLIDEGGRPIFLLDSSAEG